MSYPPPTQLANAFAEFERHRSDLSGHKFLCRALDMASDVLLDDQKLESHAQVRTFVALWFERVCNWLYAAHTKERPSWDAIKLHLQNVELFNDPIFELPENRFDSSGNLERSLEFSELLHKETCTKADTNRFFELLINSIASQERSHRDGNSKA